MAHSPWFLSPLADSLLLPLLPLFPFPLTWNPPSCDRIRPPRSPFACKLNSPSPCPCSLTPHSEIPTPQGFPPPNIHSLARYRETGSHDPAHYPLGVLVRLQRLGLISAGQSQPQAQSLEPIIYRYIRYVGSRICHTRLGYVRLECAKKVRNSSLVHHELALLAQKCCCFAITRTDLRN